MAGDGVDRYHVAADGDFRFTIQAEADVALAVIERSLRYLHGLCAKANVAARGNRGGQKQEGETARIEQCHWYQHNNRAPGAPEPPRPAARGPALPAAREPPGARPALPAARGRLPPAQPCPDAREPALPLTRADSAALPCRCSSRTRTRRTPRQPSARPRDNRGPR